MAGLSPACMKCQQVTGKSTCFPKPCVFHNERNVSGTKSHDIAALDRIRRGSRDLVHVPTLLPYEGLSEAMYSLSAQLAMTGWLDDDTNHVIYERVVKAWQSLDRSQTP